MSTPPADKSIAQGAARLFLSYSRRDHEFTRRLAEALAAAGYDVWVDLEDIQPSEDWMAAIRSAIEGADAIVFVVSPDSVDPASVCAAELEHAVASGKRLAPVVCRDVDTRSVRVPDAVARLNWIGFQDAAGFEAALARLRTAVETDLDWVREHTRLTVRSSEWQRAGRDDSFLLQKNDLSAAEDWLRRRGDRQPAPSALQTEYVLVSRAVAERRRRRLLGGAVLAGLLVLAGALVAWQQSREAAERRAESLARALAAEAQFERTRRLDRAVVLAAQGLRTRETPETLDAALSVGQTAQDVVRVLQGHRERIDALCFVAGGHQLASASHDGQLIVWDLASAAPLQRLTADDPSRLSLACHPTEPLLATWRGGARLELWTVAATGLQPKATIEVAAEPDAVPFARLAFSADGRWLARSDGESVGIHAVADGRAVPSTIRWDEGISALALSHDGAWVAIGTPGSELQGDEKPGRVLLWARDATQPRFVADPFGLGTRQVAVSEQGEQVIALGVEGGIVAFSADGKPLDLGLPGGFAPAESRAAAFDTSGRRFVNAAGRVAVFVGSLDTPVSYQWSQTLAAHGRAVTATAVELASRRLASGDEQGLVMVHHLRTDADLDGGRRVSPADAVLQEAYFGADGRSVVLRLVDGPKYLEQIVALPGVAVTAAPASVARGTAPPLRVETRGPAATLLGTAASTPIARMVVREGEDALSAAVAADGRLWAAASENTVRFQPVQGDASVVAMLPPSFGLVSAVALSPDGRLGAAAGGDTTTALGIRFGMSRKSIVLVDARSGRVVGLPLAGISAGAVEQLSFSADGRHLLSVGPEAVLWPVDPAGWIERACDALAVGVDASGWARVLPEVPRPTGC